MIALNLTDARSAEERKRDLSPIKNRALFLTPDKNQLAR
jgi:hypothetical protein